MNYLHLMSPGWEKALSNYLSEPYLASLAAFVERERSMGVSVFPPKDLVFNALQTTPFEEVKVVIVGQDPYHSPGQAHGLCFSVPKGVPSPPSLQNIYKEINQDLGLPIPTHGCLTSWAKQGVLLLNATLTVRQGEPMSHHGKGWEIFTDAIISAVAGKESPVIFVLWGKSAQQKCAKLAVEDPQKKHFVLKAPHPSPLSAHQGFFGCGHFSKINSILVQNNQKPIDWRIVEQ